MILLLTKAQPLRCCILTLGLTITTHILSSIVVSVKRIHAHHGKPDIIRVVSDLNLVMMSYPGLLMVEMISLDKDQGQDKDYLDLNRSEGQVEHDHAKYFPLMLNIFYAGGARDGQRL